VGWLLIAAIGFQALTLPKVVLQPWLSPVHRDLEGHSGSEESSKGSRLSELVTADSVRGRRDDADRHRAGEKWPRWEILRRASLGPALLVRSGEHAGRNGIGGPLRC
jgi:hypothetical protein